MGPTPLPPGPGQESVWDYPRPPKLEHIDAHLRVMAGDQVLADSNGGYRVLETSHPPTYYLPPESVRVAWLSPVGQSVCEWKGMSTSFDLDAPHMQVPRMAWGYPAPAPAFKPIRGHFAFYAGRAGHCYVDGEQVTPQPGDFYGGWITDAVAGPFKGIPGSALW